MAEHLGIEPGELAQWADVKNAEDAKDAARRVEQLRQAKTELADADARKRALDAATDVE